MIEKEDVAMGGEVLASLGGIAKVGPRMPATELKVDAPFERIGMASPIMMDVEMVEVALAVALPTLPIIAEEEEVQVTGLLISAMPAQPIITEIAEEEVPITTGLLAIDTMAGALLAIIDALMGKVVGEAKVTPMVSLQ